MQLCGDFFAMMIHEEHDVKPTTMLVWDWKSGQLKMVSRKVFEHCCDPHTKSCPVKQDLRGNDEVGYTCQSFMLLYPSWIVLPIATTDPLYPERGCANGVLVILDCSTTIPNACTYQVAMLNYSLAHFHLPGQAKDARCTNINVHAHEASRTVTSPGSGTYPNVDVPFHASPRLQLLPIYLEMVTADGTERSYTLFVPSGLLHDWVRGLRRHAAQAAKKRLCIPWRVWGKWTRMIPDLPLAFDVHTSGMRLIAFEDDFDLQDPVPRRLCMYNFAPPLLFRREVMLGPSTVLLASADSEDFWELSDEHVNVPMYVKEPSIIDDPDVWADKVETALPFTKTRSDILDDGRGEFHITSECIIMMHPDDGYVLLALHSDRSTSTHRYKTQTITHVSHPYVLKTSLPLTSRRTGRRYPWKIPQVIVEIFMYHVCYNLALAVLGLIKQSLYGSCDLSEMTCGEEFPGAF